MCEICGKSICPPRCPNSDYEEVTVCENCGKHIRRGEYAYDVNGDAYCEDCAEKLTIEDLVKCGSVHKEVAQ